MNLRIYINTSFCPYYYKYLEYYLRALRYSASYLKLRKLPLSTQNIERELTLDSLKLRFKLRYIRRVELLKNITIDTFLYI